MTRLLITALLCLACTSKPLPHSAPTGKQWPEIDARREALLECLPPSAIKLRVDPQVRVGPDCIVYTSDGRRSRGYTDMRQLIVVPRDLGALAHEYAHWYTRDRGHNGYTATCGDPIDTQFLRMKPHCSKGDAR